MQRARNAHFHPELAGLPGFAFADAIHLGRVPGVEPGLLISSLAPAALGHDAPGLVQGFTERFVDS